jgi:hypothetical protein
VTTKNFFAPLKTMNMDNDAPGTGSSAAEELVPKKASRPSPIALASATNLMQKQKQLIGVAEQQF